MAVYRCGGLLTWWIQYQGGEGWIRVVHIWLGMANVMAGFVVSFNVITNS